MIYKFKVTELNSDEIRYFKTKREAYEWAEMSFGFFVEDNKEVS